MKRWSLKNIMLKRTDVVDAGDNPEANIMLIKEKEGGQEKMAKTYDEIIKGLPVEEAELITAEIEKMKTMNSSTMTPEEQAKMKAKLIAGGMTEAEAIAKTTEAPKQMTEEEKAKMMADEKAKFLAAPDDVKKEEEKIAKADFAKISKENEDLKEEIKKGKVEAARVVFEKEADKLDRLTISKEDMVSLFEDAGSSIEKLRTVLTAANEQLKAANIFKTVGNSSDKEESAKETLDRLAKERAKETKETYAVAYTAIAKSNRELVKKYKEEEV